MGHPKSHPFAKAKGWGTRRPTHAAMRPRHEWGTRLWSTLGWCVGWVDCAMMPRLADLAIQGGDLHEVEGKNAHREDVERGVGGVAGAGYGCARAQSGGEHRGPTSGARSGRGELQVYFVDVEGGQSTLFVMPGGESLLVDTGSPDSRNPTAPRDATRIAAVCKLAGVTKIDNLVVTHYHSDHVGGLPQLVGMVPVGRFIDHGVNREAADVQGGASTIAGYDAYQKVLAEGHAEHLTVKPGDVLPVKAMQVEVVSGDGEVIAQATGAAGAASRIRTARRRR